MKYIFMNKNTPVFIFSMKDYHITKIEKVLNPEYLPFQIPFEKKIGKVVRRDFEKFISGRAIPETRENLQKILKISGAESSKALSLKHYGLSLSDQYWFKKEDEDISWSDINFFKNDFSEDMSLIMFGEDVESISLKSPDNTSDGWLNKAWKIVNGKRYLVKAGSGVYKQEPFNEAIAYKIASEFGIDHVEYEVKKIGEEYYSFCPNFITENTELVPISAISKRFKKENHVSTFDFVCNSLESLGISDAREKIGEMLFLDYIIFNEDRHFNNFGFIRDVESLKVLGLAPIYDSGTSLFYNTREEIIPHTVPEAKPFSEKREKQRELIKVPESVIDIDVEKISEIIISEFSKNDIGEKYYPERKRIIARRVIEEILKFKN